MLEYLAAEQCSKFLKTWQEHVNFITKMEITHAILYNM